MIQEGDQILRQSPEWKKVINTFYPIQTRRNFLKIVGTAVAITPFISAPNPAIAKAEITRSQKNQIDYNECASSEAFDVALGKRVLSYCTSEKGEYTLIPRPDLPELMKDAARVTGRKIYLASDPFHDSDPIADLAGIFTVAYSSQQPPEEAFAFKWTVGTIAKPYGSYQTHWFSEQTLKQINFLYMQWINRQMYRIATFDNHSEEVYIPQDYAHLWNVTPVKEPTPPNGS